MPAQETLRILHVDDDEEDFMIIRDLINDIRQKKYSVEWASGYDEALNKIKEKDFDVFLIDYKLGKYTGIELLKEIKKNHKHKPIIIFTGQGDEKIDEEAMNAGASDYLVKGEITANILERSMRYSVSQAQTQQKLIENEENLRNSEKFAVTGRVAQVIAHEIRNPLTNLLLAVHQIEDELPDISENVRALLQLIERNCNRINQLITNLLDSTKFADLKFEDVSINTLLDEAIELARDRIELKHIRIIKQYDPDICDIYIDKEKIKIAFLNLVINAIEAVEEKKGVLTFKTEGKNDKCSVIISDNGDGIDPENLPRIFEPFFTSKRTGTGLGLTNTQNIILNHKGTIRVESKKHVGTSFIITFDFSPNKYKKQ